MLKRLSRSVVTVSTGVSVAAVLGLASLPLLHDGAVSTLGAATRQPGAVAIETVPARPVPLAEDAAGGAAIQLAARRSRSRPEPPVGARATEPPAHKTSAISPASEQAAAPETKPKTDEPVAKAEKSASAAPPEPTTPPEPPKPQTWSEAEVIAGLRECVRLLAPIAAEVEISQPVRHDVCGAPAPVLLKRIGSGAAKVEISPPAVLNCAMVASLHAWVEKTLQPTAREALGHVHRPPAQRLGLRLPRAQRPPARHRQAERACARQRHRHRRLRHGRRPHHRRRALLGPDRARSARAPTVAAAAPRQSRPRRTAAKAEPVQVRGPPTGRSAPSRTDLRGAAQGQEAGRRSAAQDGGPAAAGQGHVRHQRRPQGHSGTGAAPSARTPRRARRPPSCIGCTRARAACSARCWAPRPTRCTATISISTWPPAGAAPCAIRQ